MTKKTVFTGSGVAIVTPMHADGSINWEKLGSLIDWHIESGTDSIIICGTTGESATMTDQEHIDLINYAVKRVAGRIPVVAGAGSNDTKYAINLALEAYDAGADALLVVTPYYNKASQRGLIKHYNMIADATPLPLIVYNVPSRTGCNILPATYAELCKHPNIVAAKEANGNITAIAQTRALCGDDLQIYSGNDDQVVPIMSLGGIGVISVIANIMPRETHDMCELYLQGKVKESSRIQLELISLIDALFIDVNPIPVKAAMNMMGFDVGACRMPLCDMSDANLAVLKAELIKHNLLK